MNGEERSSSFRHTALWVLVSGACYYLATQIAWALCFPNSKVSLFFLPHAVLVSVLLLVPTRHWWAYILAAAGGHFLATQQAHWPLLYSLHCEVFDAVQNVLVAAGIRIFIKSPWKLITLRDAIVFVLIAVVIVPFGTAFWGAAFTLSNHFGTNYWVEWRNLGISNGVTAIVLVPAILLGASHLSDWREKTAPGRLLEAGVLGAGLLTVGYFAFGRLPAGPDTSPALLYAPIPLLIWAALRFGLGGMSVSMLAITCLAIWGTMHGRGPFLAQAPAQNALALQMFLLVTATPLMFLAVVFDEAKRSQRAMRESELRFRSMADTAPVMIWVSGPDKGCVYFNRRWLDFTGRSHEAEVGDGWIANVHPEDVDSRVIGYRQAFDSREPFTVEYRLRRRDGQYRWILAQAVPRMAGGGEFLGYIGSCLDITDRKQAETEMQELHHELAHAGRVTMLGQLSASLAHELNQPLGAILRNAEAAEIFLRSDRPDLDELRAIITDIRKDDQRAGAVIDRLRDLLKRRQLDLSPVSLSSLVDEVVLLTKTDSTTRHVVIDVDVPNQLPLVRGDRVHLQQVLLNLIINGMDALADIADDSRMLTVCAQRDGGDFVEVAVSDNGHGIPAARLDRLFEPFFTMKPHGMGLGLSISRTVITAHGGRLWAENNPGGGATFRFTLPVAERERGERRGRERRDESTFTGGIWRLSEIARAF